MFLVSTLDLKEETSCIRDFAYTIPTICGFIIKMRMEKSWVELTGLTTVVLGNNIDDGGGGGSRNKLHIICT